MTILYGFQLIRDRNIAETSVRSLLYKHVKTGAELLSLISGDENKVFNITFRTPSYNSTGAAHIMEHSVLCGSRKYSCKEPFIELVKGSLNTCLYAETMIEATSYAVASANLKDFYNLIDVYLDAVFYPLITERTFHQEGWRCELETIEDEMVFKGVVLNE